MPGAVDDELGLDVAERGVDAGDAALLLGHRGDGAVLDQPRALAARALRERHRDADRVGAAVLLDVEPREQVVGPGERKQVGDLRRRDLVDVDAEQAVERGDPAVLLEAVGVGGGLDEAGAAKPGRLAGLVLEPLVEVAAVLAHPRRGLRRRAERHHQTGGVPGGAGGELVALEQQHVPARVGEVIRDRATDDAAADDDDARARRKIDHDAERTENVATVGMGWTSARCSPATRSVHVHLDVAGRAAAAPAPGTPALLPVLHAWSSLHDPPPHDRPPPLPSPVVPVPPLDPMQAAGLLPSWPGMPPPGAATAAVRRHDRERVDGHGRSLQADHPAGAATGTGAQPGRATASPGAGCVDLAVHVNRGAGEQPHRATAIAGDSAVTTPAALAAAPEVARRHRRNRDPTVATTRAVDRTAVAAGSLEAAPRRPPAEPTAGGLSTIA